jgi:hypothetical protein
MAARFKTLKIFSILLRFFLHLKKKLLLTRYATQANMLLYMKSRYFCMWMDGS